MRRAARTAFAIGIMAAALAAVDGPDMRFVSPTWDAPRYEVRLAFDVEGAPVTVKEVRLQGSPFAAFRVFRAGKLADSAKPLEKGAYEIVVDYAWSSGQRYTLDVMGLRSDGTEADAPSVTALSPASGGVPPGAAEGFYRVFRIEETAGLERTDEVVELVVTGARDTLPSPELRLFDGSMELPFEVLAFEGSEPVEKAAKTNPPSVTAKVACPISVGPNGKKLLLVFKGRSRAARRGGIDLAGEGLGKTLATPHLVLKFHEKSGQILTIAAPPDGIELHNKAGVIHWNPDVFVPGVAWDHSFDWNPPASFEEKQGAFFYVNARRGPMPRVRDVGLEVRYQVDAFHPWFISETRMVVEKDIGAIAVRNDEMVLSRELFDGYMYRAADGGTVTGPLEELPETPFGLVHIAPPDLPWAGLINTAEGFGFFSLRLAAAASGLGPGGDFALKAGTYFYAPSDGNYVYWVRPLVYTWADYATNDLMSFVPAGSFFYEKNAYIALRLDDGTPRTLDRLVRALREPLRVF